MPTLVSRYTKLTNGQRVPVIHRGDDLLPAGIHEYFGTHNVDDDPHRYGRCYELAWWALCMGDAPRQSILVHGSMHGPERGMQRIGHAWLELPDGLLWEPTMGRIYDFDEWMHFARAQAEREYTQREARIMALRHEHYGRWHVSRWP